LPETAVRELDFEQPVVNIGSDPQNDILLNGENVQPFHAMLLLEDDQCELLPLSPEADIFLDGARVGANAVPLGENQRVDIGAFSLSVHHTGKPAFLHVTVAAGGSAPVPVDLSSDDSERAILLSVQPVAAEAAVSQTAVYTVEITNAGPIVASFQLSVQGVPEEWVQVSPRMANLNEGQRATLRVEITPPHLPSSSAGKHPITLIVTSPNYPRQRSIATADLTIPPYFDFILGNLSPRQQSIAYRTRSGVTNLPITNQGNSDTHFDVAASDEENGCSFGFRLSENLELYKQAVIAIPAGQTVVLPIAITPLKRQLVAMSGKQYHYTTTVQVTGQPAIPQALSGSVSSRPMFGWWTVLLAVLLVMAGLFVLLQPRINYFQVAAGKDIIELGDSTSLEWSVSPFASRLGITGIDKQITGGQSHLLVSPIQSTTYELTAGNWLSSLMSLDRKKSQTVLVVPPTPQVGVFDVDQTTVNKGQPVNIRWSVAKADKAFLTIDEVVYELPADQFSGVKSVVLEKDAIVSLEAKNSSGSELRSYFVKVVPPHITINSFTVWVRPVTTAAATSSTANVALKQNTAVASNPRLGLLISPLATPAPSTAPSDFPQKYVELVPDSSADAGYRVEFNQPARELAKGEQVMLEWNVDGVDTVTIAPFTEQLPKQGKQPFFPQESMNFTLTAKSGDLQQLFMLPVKVFDGQAPKAPTIDFFKASPQQMVGSSTVEFSWSVSGEWTHVQLSNADAVVADWLNAQGFKKTTVSKSTTYILTAWNGSLSTAQPVSITVDPGKVPVSLSVTSLYPDLTQALTGQSLTVAVGFSNLPSDKPKPTGTINVTDGSSSCAILLPAQSCLLTFKTPGDKSITASYAGDSIYLQGDSLPYGHTVKVQGPEVDLVPRYFMLDTGAPISNIADPTLELDMAKGLHVVVEVRPKTVSLPDDSKSHVNLSLCGQDAAKQMITSSCQFIGGSTVAKATDTTFGKTVGLFYSDIVIPRFLTAGTRTLLFNYVHDTNAINPARITQPDVTIGKVKIHLSLPICTAPDALTGCKLGAADPSNAVVMFDIHTESPNTDLLSTLPAPIDSAFTVTVQGTGTPTPAPGAWACKVVVISGTYKLKCSVSLDPAQNPYTVTFTFNNDLSDSYYMVDKNPPSTKTINFTLNVLNSTKVVIGNLTGAKVGQIIRLTGSGGLVSVQTAAGTPIAPSKGSMTVTDTTGGTNTFGVASTSNCSLNASGGIDIIDTTANCDIYYKKAGDIGLNAVYAGNSIDYLGSSNSMTAKIYQQNGLTATWQYSANGGTSYQAWGPTDLIVNRQLPIRVIVSGPATNFNQDVLVSRNMLVKLTSGIQNCAITAPGTGTDGEYLIELSNDTSVTPNRIMGNFQISCDTYPLDISFSLGFVNVGDDKTGDDFAFSQTYSQPLHIKVNDTVTMGVDIERAPLGAHTNMVSATSIDWFHVGERYAVTFTVEMLGGSYYSWTGPFASNQDILNEYLNNNNSIDVALPPGMTSNIDWTQSTCGAQNNMKVRLNRALVVSQNNYSDRTWDFWGVHWDYWYWGDISFKLYNDPCYLVFKPDVTVNQNSTFNYISHNNIYTVSRSFMTPGVAKQNLSMSFTPASSLTSFIGMPGTVTLNMASTTNTDTSLPAIESNITSFDSQLSANVDCGTISAKTVNPPNQATITLNSTAECLNKTLTVTYLQNPYFNALSNRTYTFNFSKHTAATTLEYQPSGGAWTATFPFNQTSAKAQASTAYAFRVTAADHDGSGHAAFIPDGFVRVRITDPSATPATFTITSGGVAVSLNADGSYHIPLDTSGSAPFTLTFTSSGTGVAIAYDYPGSATFTSVASANSAAFDVNP
jgi:hypothetical protein